MSTLNNSIANDALTIALDGRVDSKNVKQVEADINKCVSVKPAGPIILDCQKLDLISSAGLRMILRLKQSIADTKLINVSPSVFDVLQTTGFTELMEVHRAYRVISVKNCEKIGQGSNGVVYHYDEDTIVKTYWNPDALPEIHRERELARTAFVLGVPTAISYDVVRLEDGGFGAVYELLDAKSYIKVLADGEKTLDELVDMSVDLLKLIHSREVKPETMPDMRELAMGWVEDVRALVTPEEYERLRELMEAVPQDMHMLHGDFHFKNIMLQNNESLLIDMDTLCYGHPIFELASMVNAYRCFSETDPEESMRFLGIPAETAIEIWDKSLQRYLSGADEAMIRAVEQKAMLIGHLRIMRRAYRRKLTDTPYGRKVYDHSRQRISELLRVVDSLTF